MTAADEVTPAAGRSARVLSHLLLAAALAAAIAFLVFSLAEFERVKSYMDALSFDGDAETFSGALFARLMLASRAVAALLLCAAVALFRSRREIARRLDDPVASAFAYASRTGRAIRVALRDETFAHLAILAATIALGLALRLRVLWQPINYDEAFTFIVYANRPLLIAWSHYSEPNNHLLHTLLVHVSTRLFGDAIWALRLPAFVAGIAAIPLAYVVTRSLTGRQAALLVSALTATAPVLIAFSVCARGYTMLIDFFLLAAWCGHDIITTRSKQAWPFFVIWCVLGFFTLPTFSYPFGALLIWLFVAGRRDRGNAALRFPVIARCAVWTGALVAVCYAPAAATSGLRAGFAFAQGRAPVIAFITDGWAPLRRTWLDFMRGLPTAMVAALAASAVLGVARLWRTTSGAIFLLPLLLVPALTVPIQGTLAPPRVWTYFVPIVYVYAASGVVAAAEWMSAVIGRRGPAIVSATTATLAVAICLRGTTGLPVRYTEGHATYEIYAHMDVDEAARYLKTTLTTGDALLTGLFLDFPLEYYMRQHNVPIDALRRRPPDPARVILFANEAVTWPVEKVLQRYNYDPAKASVRLMRSFAYASFYELTSYRQEP